jgi:hypothetical protein
VKLLDQLAIGWKVCVTASAISWAIGAATWGVYRRVDEWVRAQNVDSQQLAKIIGRVEKLEGAAALADRNTTTHCRLGTLPASWCEDNGYRIPKQAPAGAGG